MTKLDFLNKVYSTRNGILPEATTAQECLDLLREYLLDKEYISALPESQDQVNADIVYNILYKYSRKFRADEKLYYTMKKKLGDK